MGNDGKSPRYGHIGLGIELTQIGVAEPIIM
jgi:hypothetical protein